MVVIFFYGVWTSANGIEMTRHSLSNLALIARWLTKPRDVVQHTIKSKPDVKNTFSNLPTVKVRRTKEPQSVHPPSPER